MANFGQHMDSKTHRIGPKATIGKTHIVAPYGAPPQANTNADDARIEGDPSMAVEGQGSRFSTAQSPQHLGRPSEVTGPLGNSDRRLFMH